MKFYTAAEQEILATGKTRCSTKLVCCCRGRGFASHDATIACTACKRSTLSCSGASLSTPASISLRILIYAWVYHPSDGSHKCWLHRLWHDTGRPESQRAVSRQREPAAHKLISREANLWPAERLPGQFGAVCGGFVASTTAVTATHGIHTSRDSHLTSRQLFTNLFAMRLHAPSNEN